MISCFFLICGKLLRSRPESDETFFEKILGQGVVIFALSGTL